MQPNVRSLDQIISELNSVYEPQINLLRQQQSAIPGQIVEEEKGLQAKQTQAFDDILGGARRRGLGFSGIPLSEQARYTSTEFLPAMARLRQTGREQANSLEQAILGIQERRQNTAIEGQRYEQSRYDQWIAEQRALEERRRQEAAAQLRPTLTAEAGGRAAETVKIDGTTQKAYNDVQNLLSKDAGRIQREYEAIKKSAGYGNAYDRIKLQLLNQLYPFASQRSGQNTVPLTQSVPRLISLTPAPYSGLSVGVANPGNIRVR